MTTPPSAEFPDTGLDRRLDDGMNALTEALADILDVDAGLRDTQLFARQRSLEDRLDTIMDVDAGLGAIVPRIQPDLRADSDVPAGTLTAFATRFANHSLQERLELRSQIPVGTLRDVRTIAEVLDLALLLGQGLAVDSDASRESALARATAIAREITRTRTRTRTRNAANQLVRAFDPGYTSGRYLIKVRVHDFVSALTRDLDDALAHTHDVTLERDLTRNPGVLAREFAHAIIGYQGRVIDLTRVRDLTAAIAVIDAAATDFTAADLTRVDLGRINLQGVRWSSSTTTWPAEWQALIQEASVQVDPDRQPDLYEIRDDPHVPTTAIDTSHR